MNPLREFSNVRVETALIRIMVNDFRGHSLRQRMLEKILSWTANSGMYQNKFE